MKLSILQLRIWYDPLTLCFTKLPYYTRSAISVVLMWNISWAGFFYRLIWFTCMVLLVLYCYFIFVMFSLHEIHKGQYRSININQLYCTILIASSGIYPPTRQTKSSLDSFCQERSSIQMYYMVVFDRNCLMRTS